ncbi:MAG: hypothetical protein ACOC1F_09210, partial [Myxococcota bacterium]
MARPRRERTHAPLAPANSQPPEKPRAPVPGLRDFLVASYELAGRALAFLAHTFTEPRTTRKPTWFLIGVVIVLFYMFGSRAPGLAVLSASSIVGVIVLIHAIDIARMRGRLLFVAQHPDEREPDIPASLRARSPSIQAMWSVARCLAMARHGAASSVEPLAEDIDRAVLDRQAVRLLDGARALAA